jgi:energy-converting hydrogenase B subunit D
MNVLRDVALIAVAIAGTATVVTRDPRRQAVVAGAFGLTVALLLFVYGAPDVALSALVVSTVATPVMVLLALAKLRDSGAEGEDG